MTLSESVTIDAYNTTLPRHLGQYCFANSKFSIHGNVPLASLSRVHRAILVAMAATWQAGVASGEVGGRTEL